MERIDHWIINGKTLAIPHMGVCEVKGPKSPPGAKTSPHPVTKSADPASSWAERRYSPRDRVHNGIAEVGTRQGVVFREN